MLHTGHVEDVGLGDGKHYSVNVPLQEGMDDESYRFMFEPIMQKVCPKSNHSVLPTPTQITDSVTIFGSSRATVLT